MDDNEFNKLLKDKYFLLEDIAKKYDYSKELLDMITFIYISFYMDFGKKCDFPLYDLFNRVKIIYDEGTVSEIAFKNNFGKLPEGSAAVTVFTPNLNVFKDSSQKQNPQTIILGTHVDNYLATPALKLEMLTHEVRHALMGYNNTNILLDDNTYYMRSGLQETYFIRNGTMDVVRRGVTIDEITNTYITELLVNRIMSFKKYKIENLRLKSYLDSVKTSQPDGKYIAIGYNEEVRLLYPLLLNEILINLINLHQFDGEISVIKSFIENNTGICGYEKFSELLDAIYNGNLRYQEAVQSGDFQFIEEHKNRIEKAKTLVLDIERNINKKCI